jgi:bacterioferritin B
MRISADMNDSINAQIGRELSSSHLYLSMAAYFDDRALRKLAEFFYKQSEEERSHALKFVEYLSDVDAPVVIPAVPAPQATFSNAEEAIQMAFDAEMGITKNIHDLMKQAIDENDYQTQEMLRWFVNEQIEEVRTMEDMLKVTRASGERSIIMVEAYLVHDDV